MDYEKKYKGSMAKMSTFLAKHDGFTISKDGEIYKELSEIFPELKKSEDENIRKWIIDELKDSLNTIRSMYSGDYDNRDKDDILRESCLTKGIAWLEKQGKNNMGISEATKQKLEDNLNKALEKETPESWNEFLEKQGSCSIKWNKNTENNKPQVNHSVLMQTTHGIAEGEWQGEYWHQYRWAAIVRNSDVLSWVELSDLEKQAEQKPTDKVEPKFKVGDIIYRLSNSSCPVHSSTDNTLCTVIEVLDEHYILDTIKGKIQESFAWQDYYELVEQKPAETEKGVKGNDREIPISAWSEEDEKMWTQVIIEIEAIKSKSSTVFEKNIAQDKINWLKALRERYTWKPSDEQMLALDSAIHCYAGVSPTNNREVYALEIMKEQLKKLREE